MTAAKSFGRKNLNGQSFQACILAPAARIRKTTFHRVCCFQTRVSTVSPQHQTACQHVVQRLLFFGETRHDVPDEGGN
jgi:hypothetical protein